MKGVTVLRPQPGASITVERARERGLHPVAIPLFEIEPVDWEIPEATSFDALLITSANALRCGGDRLRELRQLPVHAVGEATAEAAREAGFDVASIGDAGVDRLLGSLAAELRLIHLCGEHRRHPDEVRQSITPVVIYRSKEVPADLLPAAGTVALIHSPRAGARFATLIDEAGINRKTIAIAAISKAAADAAGDGWNAVEFVENPGEDALLALAARLCNKPDGQ